jgi:hypothetical protein
MNVLPAQAILDTALQEFTTFNGDRSARMKVISAIDELIRAHVDRAIGLVEDTTLRPVPPSPQANQLEPLTDLDFEIYLGGVQYKGREKPGQSDK